MTDHPIDRVEWVDAERLQANDYNPNHVFAPEMELLAYSILMNGWIQPILVDQDLVVIDGFHRAALGRGHPKVREMTDGKVPVVKMEMPETERIMLTVRINRAKGQHGAIPMQALVKRLHMELGVSRAELTKGMGMNEVELDVLLSETVFAALGTGTHKYSDAWFPKTYDKKKKNG